MTPCFLVWVGRDVVGRYGEPGECGLGSNFKSSVLAG